MKSSGEAKRSAGEAAFSLESRGRLSDCRALELIAAAIVPGTASGRAPGPETERVPGMSTGDGRVPSFAIDERRIASWCAPSRAAMPAATDENEMSGECGLSSSPDALGLASETPEGSPSMPADEDVRERLHGMLGSSDDARWRGVPEALLDPPKSAAAPPLLSSLLLEESGTGNEPAVALLGPAAEDGRTSDGLRLAESGAGERGSIEATELLLVRPIRQPLLG